MTPETLNGIDELDLQAYAAGRLDRAPHLKAKVEAHLEHDPDAREAVETYRVLCAHIKGRYDGTLEESIPERLLDTIASGRGPEKRWSFRAAVATAAMVALVASASWWVGHNRYLTGAPPAVSDRILDIHLEAAAVSKEQAPSPDHRVAARRLLGTTPALKMPTPDLTAIGYGLTNSGTIQDDGERYTRLVYRDKEGDTITVLLQRPAAAAVPRANVEHFGDTDLLYWQDGPLWISVVGDGIEPNADVIVDAISKSFKDVRDDDPANTPKTPSGVPAIAEDLDGTGNGLRPNPSDATTPGKKGTAIQ